MALLKPGRNCWQVASADRVAFVVDGEAYFTAFWEAVLQAKESVVIVGWDIDSRVQLRRDKQAHRLPVQLGAFLDAVVRRRPRLHIHILNWDFAPLYLLERELLTRYKLHWATHRRLHFQMDSTQPAGGSHHQKIVVIDDTLAFVGGFDLTRCRWDSAEHRADDPRRVDNAAPYQPFHDLMMLVDGAAAQALGGLVRARWQQATGEALAPPRTRAAPWPLSVEPVMQKALVAIARTEPAVGGKPAVREVEQLYLDAIAAARHSLYIENQYLTSQTIGAALAERLQEAQGPEILLVMPCQTEGWLERATMDVLRAQLIAQLRDADRYGRLGLFYPDIEGLEEGCVNVHAKLMIVDDSLVRIGSANLSNRSMGLDTECDLAIEAGDAVRLRQAILNLRHRLLAHHLGVETRQVAQAWLDKGSLLAVVESLRGGSHTLRDLDSRTPGVLENALAEVELIDPQQPPSAWLIPDLAGAPNGAHSLTRRLSDGMLFTFGTALAWTPLERWLDRGVDALEQTLESSSRWLENRLSVKGLRTKD